VNSAIRPEVYSKEFLFIWIILLLFKVPCRFFFSVTFV